MSRTSWRSTGRVAGLSVGRLLVMLTALAGLFAMHGLSEHGVMHHDMSSSASMTAEAMSAISAVALDDAVTVTTAPVGEHIGAALGQNADMAMVLCLTILVGLVVHLMRERGRSTGLMPRLVAADTGALDARTSRDRDPPDLFALSIQRC